MSRKSFVAALHPRGRNGRFTFKGDGTKVVYKAATKAGNKPANAAQARKRRQGYARTGVRAGVGVAVGAQAIVTGRAVGSPTRTAAGVARIGLAGAHATHSARTIRRQTSAEFHAMPLKKRGLERRAAIKRSAKFEAAALTSDAALFSTDAFAKAGALRKVNKARIAALEAKKADLRKRLYDAYREESDLNEKFGRLNESIRRSQERRIMREMYSGDDIGLVSDPRKAVVLHRNPNAKKAARQFSKHLDTQYKRMHTSSRAKQNLYNPPDPFKQVDVRRTTNGAARSRAKKRPFSQADLADLVGKSFKGSTVPNDGDARLNRALFGDSPTKRAKKGKGSVSNLNDFKKKKRKRNG